MWYWVNRKVLYRFRWVYWVIRDRGFSVGDDWCGLEYRGGLSIFGYVGGWYLVYRVGERE